MADCRGHQFTKKTFHLPAYCHNCTNLLWGVVTQGNFCTVCNYIAHESCLKKPGISPCHSLAASLIKNPVSHCFSKKGRIKNQRCCNVCRKRIDSRALSVTCEVCHYYAHADCKSSAVADCKEIATYHPGKLLDSMHHEHHWREGNLRPGAVCYACVKPCWATDCLAGYRCEWCGITAHATCRSQIPYECDFGVLGPIYLPPHAVSIPRTEVPMESIIGVPIIKEEKPTPPSISVELSNGESKTKNAEDEEMFEAEKKLEEKNEELVKVYDGDASYLKHNSFTVKVPKAVKTETLISTILQSLNISQSAENFYLTDAYGLNAQVLEDPNPIKNVTRLGGKKPAVFLRLKQDSHGGLVRVYPGRLQTDIPFCVVSVDRNTTAKDLIVESLTRFGFTSHNSTDYRLSQLLLEHGVTERVLDFDEKPLNIIQNIGQESLRQMELMRFYLQLKQDPHGPNIALYIGNLPKNLSQRRYENILMTFLGEDCRFITIGPIYYEYGSLVIMYNETNTAVNAMYLLRVAEYERKHLLVLLLPNIDPVMVPAETQPLLVFVNVKSGGCQGLSLISSFRKLLNPYQVFDLGNGGPLPGLYVFRHIRDYKILVCGGDGTIGWVLQCLDNVGQDSECSSPPCAIVPLGTGNDLARVLKWGAGYNGSDEPIHLLEDVIEAEKIRLDRWTVVIHHEDRADGRPIHVPNSVGMSEDNTQMFVMNNYFGIGIDADLCLAFHKAREKNPERFNSRIGNKIEYLNVGLRKIIHPPCKNLQQGVRLEVDGKLVVLPQLEGLIILNILSWGSGAKPWGRNCNEEQFATPNHWDGMLEVVAVSGVVHLGQIQTGLRYAKRISQGEHVKIHLTNGVPVQIDGEPWVQGPGELVILKSALKATMLKKVKRTERKQTSRTRAVKYMANLQAVASVNGSENE
ncbi:hypothetical protein ACI65C_003778 [Semiaphis heraclei]